MMLLVDRCGSFSQWPNSTARCIQCCCC